MRFIALLLATVGLLSTAFSLGLYIPKLPNPFAGSAQKILAPHAALPLVSHGVLAEEVQWPDSIKWFWEALTEVEDTMHGLLNGTDKRLPAGATIEYLEKILQEAEVTVERFREAHPVEYEVVKDVMVTIVIMTFAPEPFIGIINIIGFGRFGPVLRSLASVIQAGYAGRVPKGSVFAWLTSAAMGGFAKRQLQIGFSYFAFLSQILWRLLEHLKGRPDDPLPLLSDFVPGIHPAGLQNITTHSASQTHYVCNLFISPVYASYNFVVCWRLALSPHPEDVVDDVQRE